MDIKAPRLKKGDTVAVVSLSRGLLGEDFVAHEREIAQRRLEEYGFHVRYMPNARKGLDYLDKNPQARAQDLLDAFRDREVRAILCAIGGLDTYRLAPYLFENGALAAAVKADPKIFLGFSDTTVNHMMLHRCGLGTFYGQALLTDLAELEREMLPYTRAYFEALFLTGEAREIVPSGVWYEERRSFGRDQIGVPLTAHPDSRGFEVLGGGGVFEGEILGGCVESLFKMLGGGDCEEEGEMVRRYGLFPGPEEWRGKIVLLETSEERPAPEKLREMLRTLRAAGVFDGAAGVLIGKPIDETYYGEYRQVYRQELARDGLGVVCNVNVGHAMPRCIVPLGIRARVDAWEGRISFLEPALARQP